MRDFSCHPAVKSRRGGCRKNLSLGDKSAETSVTQGRWSRGRLEEEQPSGGWAASRGRAGGVYGAENGQRGWTSLKIGTGREVGAGERAPGSF